MKELSIETAEELRSIGNIPLSILLRYLDSNGDGTGIKDMATTADTYFIKPPSGETFLIETINFTIQDNGLFPLDEYGSMGAALATGLLFRVQRQPVAASPEVEELDLLDNVPITKNEDLSLLGVVTVTVNGVLGLLSLFIDMKKLFGGPLRLNGKRGDTLELVVQDDLSSLLGQFMKVGGFKFQDANL